MAELRCLGRGSVYGFEMPVPALLELMKHEGIKLDFPSRQSLFHRRAMEHAKIQVWNLDKMPLIILHSLEASYGDSSFSSEDLRERLIGRSMMASP